MKCTNLVFVSLCFLVILFTSSCKKGKVADQHPVINTEEFSTDLPDGEYLVDSSAGVRTYALIQANKLKKFRATTFDGKESPIGYINLDFSNKSIIAGPTAKEKCLNQGCYWGCNAPISTNSSGEICNCVCPGRPPTPDPNMGGLVNVDMLGPSFNNTKITGYQIKLTFELKTSL